MTHQVVRVLENRSAAQDMRELLFTWPSDAGTPVPGQFLTVRASTGTDPLLRRPFAFSSFEPPRDGNLEGRAGIIFQRRGKATELLSGLASGDPLDIIGPLGNAFPVPVDGRTPVLLGGGIGIGPVLFFARSLAWKKPVLIIGARTAELLPDRALLNDPGLGGTTILLCTDDGSEGFRGTVVDVLRSAAGFNGRRELYACGPTPMLRALHAAALESETPCWVSMEQMMACAVGACMGCVIAVKNDRKFARVCTEGPVFDSADIDWSR